MLLHAIAVTTVTKSCGIPEASNSLHAHHHFDLSQAFYSGYGAVQQYCT